MLSPAVTTPIRSVCPKCGTIARSGKLSCCGHGGSWFGNCGNAGNANFGHTWNEGIQACKSRQSKKIVGQQLYDPHPQGNVPSNDDSTSMNFKEVVAATQMFAFESASIPRASTDVIATANASISARDYEELLHVIICIDIIFIVCWYRQ